MSPDVSLVVSGLSTSFIGTAALALLLPLLRNCQVIDVPNHRSSHTSTTVRGGGLGIVAALLAGLTLGVVLFPFSGSALLAVFWFGLAVTLFGAVGWAEDLRGLSVRTRLGAQVLIAGAIGGTALGGLPRWLGLLAAAGGVFYVNAANFMDGVNGISGWHGTVVGAYFAAIGFMSDSAGLTLAGVVTAAAFLGFLPWNAPRARMFMGDVGSYTLGAAAWALCVFAVAVGTPLLVAVAPLVIYAGDVVFTLLRRARRRAPLFDAHREHTYQQVQQITGSHEFSTSLATAATTACVAIPFLVSQSQEPTPWAFAATLAVLASYLASPALLARRRGLIAAVDQR